MMRYFKLIMPNNDISVCASDIDEGADIGDYIEITKAEYDELVEQILEHDDDEPVDPSGDDPVSGAELINMLEEIL